MSIQSRTDVDPQTGKILPTIRVGAHLGQISDAPTRAPFHRRAHSETFFRFPDLDDILVDGVLADLNLETPPSMQAPQQQQKRNDGLAHLRSLSVDADFFEGLVLDGPPSAEAAPPGPRHRHSNSMDDYSSATSSCEVDSNAKKSIAADRLAELALIDPKRAKKGCCMCRILANRQSAARSKERKTRYTGELERKVQTLQSEATTLSAKITLLQRDTSALTAENKELKLKLQAMEQQAHLRDALNEALRNELQWLKIAAGQMHGSNGSSRGASSPFSPPQPPTQNYYAQQQHTSPNNANGGLMMPLRHSHLSKRSILSVVYKHLCKCSIYIHAIEWLSCVI
ncbi:transcription factor VIP1-like [Salvia hispanica]|uniref:transcription factor VIP1-like n=1 Tax=Salvia hispanica TaxID=49212 RepID=UPI002009D1FE|nr:transcription factor VIP1-like [Salvia hispanica]